MTTYQRWKGIMKAYPFEESRLAKWTPPYIVQPKYDGVRCRAVPLPSGEYILLSSEENVIFSVPHINKCFKYLFGYSQPKGGPELDGELYCHGMSFEEIVSITSRTVNIHPDHKMIQFHCFDIINEDDQVRRQMTINSLGPDRHAIIVISPYWICTNLEDIMEVYDQIIKSGFEGIIVRHFQNHYEKKRSIWLMKFKPKQQDIYKIVGVKEEISKDGNPKNSLGAIICKSGDGNTFDVGSGFSKEKRNELWKIRDKLAGLNATVKYQHITPGRKVPRFPVFVEITGYDTPLQNLE